MRTAIYHQKEFDFNTGLISRGHLKVEIIGETDKSYHVKILQSNKTKWVRKYNVKECDANNIRSPYKN